MKMEKLSELVEFIRSKSNEKYMDTQDLNERFEAYNKIYDFVGFEETIRFMVIWGRLVDPFWVIDENNGFGERVFPDKTIQEIKDMVNKISKEEEIEY